MSPISAFGETADERSWTLMKRDTLVWTVSLQHSQWVDLRAQSGKFNDLNERRNSVTWLPCDSTHVFLV